MYLRPHMQRAHMRSFTHHRLFRQKPLHTMVWTHKDAGPDEAVGVILKAQDAIRNANANKYKANGEEQPPAARLLVIDAHLLDNDRFRRHRRFDRLRNGGIPCRRRSHQRQYRWATAVVQHFVGVACIRRPKAVDAACDDRRNGLIATRCRDHRPRPGSVAEVVGRWDAAVLGCQGSGALTPEKHVSRSLAVAGHLTGMNQTAVLVEMDALIAVDPA